MYKTHRFTYILFLLFVSALAGCSSRKNSIPTIVKIQKVRKTHQDPQRSFRKPKEEPDQFKEDLDRVKVPNVLHLSKDEAKKRIKDAGLKVGNITYVPRSPNCSLGQGGVLKQCPQAGTDIASGTCIDLQVASKAPFSLSLNGPSHARSQSVTSIKKM